MIIQYYKGYVPLELLRDMTHTDINGVSAYNLKATAIKIGFECKGEKISNINNISTPCIVHVTLSNHLDHYIVIYKVNRKNKELVIADPAKGICKIKYNEFSKIFNNIILTFYKKTELPLYSKPISYKQFIINILKKYKTNFFKVILFSLFITVLSILTSFYIEIIYKLAEKNYQFLLFTIFCCFFVAYILKNIMDYIRNRIFLKIYRNVYADLTNNIFTKIIKLPYQYFKNRTTGEVVNRINDLQIISSVSIKVIVTFIMDGLIFILLGLFLMFTNFNLFLYSLLVYLIYLFLIMFLNKTLNKSIINLKDNKIMTDSYSYESIKNFETIKGLSIENDISKKFIYLNKNYIGSIKKTDNLLNAEMFLKNIIFDLCTCFIIFASSYLNGIENVHIISSYFLMIYFFTPIVDFVDLYKDLKESYISYERICELLFEQENNKTVSNIKFNDIEYRNLNYKYYNQKSLLNNVNLKIKKNNKIMFIGNSGSGKSTLLKILKKYYKVNDNSIFINKIDINKLSKQDITDNITYVSQNEYLFTDNLYNNLALNRNISIKKINEILKICCIDFMNLYDFIEEDGFNLSGGQKQRIILARALLNNFNILLLDEVFNQIDVDLERKILKNLFSKYKNKIIIIVSHRNNNMDLFDKIVKFDCGNCCCIERK